VLERFGNERLLFGTGLPSCDPGGPIARVYYTHGSDADLAAIAHGNLERLLSRVRLGEEVNP
jgi:predicted TIM-barrel fold metal-dependent hydrolase